MEYRAVAEGGVVVVEGPVGQDCLRGAADINRLIEACWESQAGSALLYFENLPAGFFELSSGLAGEILQKLQNYRIRLALVCPPGSVSLSRRFEELLAEERKGRTFGVFATRPEALAWIVG